MVYRYILSVYMYSTREVLIFLFNVYLFILFMYFFIFKHLIYVIVIISKVKNSVNWKLKVLDEIKHLFTRHISVDLQSVLSTLLYKVIVFINNLRILVHVLLGIRDNWCKHIIGVWYNFWRFPHDGLKRKIYWSEIDSKSIHIVFFSHLNSFIPLKRTACFRHQQYFDTV